MKRLLLLLALYLIIGSVSAVVTPLTFQNPHDFTDVTLIGNGQDGLGQASPFVFSTTAGNQYIWPRDLQGVQNLNGVPYTYAAWTSFNSGYLDSVILGDAGNTTIATLSFPNNMGVPNRIEVIVIGGTAYLYQNGILQATSGALSANPFFVRFQDGYGGTGRASFDDFILGGTSDSRYVVGMPTSNGYYLKKDLISPASSGIYNKSNDALVDSNNMYSTWGRSNVSGQALVNESIYLINEDTGTIYETHYTGTATAGTTTWNVATSLFAASAPYGRYQVKFGDFYSTDIDYIAGGATIAFDRTSYNQMDTAHVNYTIAGGYWDTSTYTYAMKIYSASTWAVVSNQPIFASSGTFTYTFTTSDPQGLYYAVIVATPNAGGSAIWMNYAYANLLAYATFTGYVNGAETNSVLSGANVSFSQGSIIQNSITTADGNYSATGFLTGATLTANVTKSGYSQYYVTMIPMVAKTTTLNLTINSTTPTITGLGIGGVVRTGTLTGTTITNGYGQPIGGATCYAKNTTNSEIYSNVTNMAAWYKFDESNGCVLTSKRPYDIWCQKAGYTGGNYTAVAA
jgi:hypothetical protein